MSVLGVFDRRVRGFRVIEIGGLGVLLVLALVVYLAKTHAGSERADIDRIQGQIDSEQARVALLKAEVAKLQQPERLETLSGRYLNLQPVPAAHEISAAGLTALAHPSTPPSVQAAPAAAAAPAQNAAPPPAAPTVAADARPVRAPTRMAIAAVHPLHTLAGHPSHVAAAPGPRPAPDAGSAMADEDKGPPL